MYRDTETGAILTDSIKDEIKEITGAEEVVLYEYSGSYSVDQWNIA